MSLSRPSFLVPRAATLRGDTIMLRPLGKRDADELALVPDDPAWEFLIRRPAGNGVEPERWLADALRGQRHGTERCWTVRDVHTKQLLGTTRFLNLDLAHRRLEIGATWFLPEARGTCANAESKLLLLDHAFADLGVQRVHIQADVRNEVSRRAIEQLGASFEGVLRRHIVLPCGTVRDTAVYSIIADEWEELRPSLAVRANAKPPTWRARPSSLVLPADDHAESTIAATGTLAPGALLDAAANALGLTPEGAASA